LPFTEEREITRVLPRIGCRGQAVG
jgi:hypothetical protein